MKKVFSLFLFITFITVAGLHAQNRFAVSLKAGYGTGAYEAAGTGLSKGKFALRVGLSYSFLPILDAYVAYSRTGFACGENAGGFCNTAPVDFTTTGYKAGFRINRGPNASIWIPWLRAGLVYGTLEISQSVSRRGTGEPFSYSDSGLGFEIGAGFAFPITEKFKIVPAVNYTRYSITAKDGSGQAVVVITALIGARYEF